MTKDNLDHDARVKAARESFSGRTLTESQFQNAWAISGIVAQEIQKTGSFRDTLTDYAHAFARSERFDALRGEAIVRDVYQGRYGQTMNQTREGLMANEKALNLTDDIQARVLGSANKVLDLIKEGQTQPYYQAHDQAASDLSEGLNITQSRAKDLMADAFEKAHPNSLYETAKETEEAYHKPVREAEIAERKQQQLENRTQSQTVSQTMS